MSSSPKGTGRSQSLWLPLADKVSHSIGEMICCCASRRRTLRAGLEAGEVEISPLAPGDPILQKYARTQFCKSSEVSFKWAAEGR
jgi:hypothetical protein